MAQLFGFRCETCGYESGHLSVYLRHLATHDDKQKFTCSICAKSFKQRNYLQKHLRKHTGNHYFIFIFPEQIGILQEFIT